MALDGTITNKSSTYTLPSFLPLHDVCLIFPDEQTTYGSDDVRCRHKGSSHTCNLPRALAYKPFRSSDRYDLLSIVLDVLSSCNFEPLPILGTSRFLCGYFGKHALRHYVLRCSRVATVTFFQVHCAPLCVSLDQVVQFSRRLLFFVVFCKV